MTLIFLNLSSKQLSWAWNWKLSTLNIKTFSTKPFQFPKKNQNKENSFDSNRNIKWSSKSEERVQKWLAFKSSFTKIYYLGVRCLFGWMRRNPWFNHGKFRSDFSMCMSVLTYCKLLSDMTGLSSLGVPCVPRHTQFLEDQLSLHAVSVYKNQSYKNQRWIFGKI